MAKLELNAAIACGTALRNARERLGWTREELSSMVSISTRYLAAIELGSRTPSVEVVTRLIRAMGCSADDIFYADAEHPKGKAHEYINLFECCTERSQELVVELLKQLPKK